MAVFYRTKRRLIVFAMLTLMKTPKRELIIFSMTLIALLVGACGTVTTMPTTAPTLTAIGSTSTALPIPSVTTIPSLPISSAPDGLRMAYVIDGNLYLQDGSNPPVQLTHSGEDRNPIFSDDGEKIAFYRGLVPHDLYSINADGTQERVLVTGSLLESLELGYNKFTEIVSRDYVPGTHQILFNTRQLSQADIDQKDFNRLGSKENFDLLSVDTDTGEIKRLLSKSKGGNFFISPNGNMVAIQVKGHIDVIGVDGQIIRQNLVTYTPTRPYELDPGVFWTEDSTELVVTLPIESEYNMDGPAMRSVWHYSVNGANKVQASLTPPPISDDYSISPDGNWILYSYYYYPDKTDETVSPGLYLGNLREGGTLLYSPDIVVPMWSTVMTISGRRLRMKTAVKDILFSPK
jgi:Tol biopolymer transport system component